MEELKRQPIAVLGIPKNPTHVPDSIITHKNVLELLGNSGDHLVDAAELTTQTEHLETLETKQAAMSGGGPDKTEQRNIAYSVVFNDHQTDMMKVQIKANSLPDPEQAAALIKRNGFQMAKSTTPALSPAIWIKNKPGFTGVILAYVKAPDTAQKFAIEWEYSYDNGETWIRIHATGVCDREISNLTQKNAVIVHARFIIGYDDPSDWMVSNSINI
jgi:hypothetical protein